MITRRHLLAALFVWLALGTITRAQTSSLDEAAPPGANYDVAEFRLWWPESASRLRAVAVLVPGSNGDGRAQVDDPFWREFATKHQVALVGCRFTDKPHDQMFLESYVDVSKGTGQALIDALARFAARSGHQELASSPLLLWGMSAGGEFDYEFAMWKPERVLAFIVNKGNVYYTALAPPAGRDVPGMMFIGQNDLAFRNDAIKGIFALNRRAGALWGLAEEPGIAHDVGRSRDYAAMFFEDMIAMRLPEADRPDGPLKPLAASSGYFGDPGTRTFQPAAGAEAPKAPVSWLPTERLARAWQAIISGKPFD